MGIGTVEFRLAFVVASVGRIRSASIQGNFELRMRLEGISRVVKESLLDTHQEPSAVIGSRLMESLTRGAEARM